MKEYLKHKRYSAMGVLNVTPNSFSESHLSRQNNKIEFDYNALTQWSDIIDIGAESTAPMNEPISGSEELDRLEYLFAKIYQGMPFNRISIDTYRPEVFYEVYLWFKTHWPKTKLIWNDVSGLVDSDCLSLLKECPDIEYVLCHNRVPHRDETSHHMNYASENFDITKEVFEFFNENTYKLKKHNLILDLCFGFAKTREQNYRLFQNMRTFINQFNQYQHLIGISRKSFLRFDPIKDSKSDFNKHHLDALGAMVMNELDLNSPQIIYRVHNPNSFLLWDHFKELDI